jgi:L-alanine-DL-glutamate epimerase-like enolase superfamily enzyme
MKITDIAIHVLKSPLAEPFAFQQLVREPIQQVGGWVQIPDRPGLGLEIDRAMLDRYRG